MDVVIPKDIVAATKMSEAQLKLEVCRGFEDSK